MRSPLVTIEADLLRAILTTVGRQTFPLDALTEIVGGEKQVKAFNLCDGTNSQAQIAAAAGIDQGNFSRTLKRWVDQGVVFRTGDPNDIRPLHIYPLVEGTIRKGKTRDG